VNGIEMNTGALGHGLPIGVGMALAAKMDAGESGNIQHSTFNPQPPSAARFRVFTLLGDGELAEGSNWEAAMAAAHYRLDNLIAIIDHNTLQITGHTRDVCCNEPLDEKWRAFGWTVRTVNGHRIAELTAALSAPPEAGKPTCIIANTVKGRGVSFMENIAKWHHGVPSKAELASALAELDAEENRLRSAP
jgi:transketolase